MEEKKYEKTVSEDFVGLVEKFTRPASKVAPHKPHLYDAEVLAAEFSRVIGENVGQPDYALVKVVGPDAWLIDTGKRTALNQSPAHRKASPDEFCLLEMDAKSKKHLFWKAQRASLCSDAAAVLAQALSDFAGTSELEIRGQLIVAVLLVCTRYPDFQNVKLTSIRDGTTVTLLAEHGEGSHVMPVLEGKDGRVWTVDVTAPQFDCFDAAGNGAPLMIREYKHRSEIGGVKNWIKEVDHNFQGVVKMSCALGSSHIVKTMVAARMAMVRKAYPTHPDETAGFCAYCERFYFRILTCARCKWTKYCTKHCQRLSWPRHKVSCAKSSK